MKGSNFRGKNGDDPLNLHRVPIYLPVKKYNFDGLLR